MATCEWAMDSGGFTELERHGGWSVTAAEFAREVRRYRDEIGRLQWSPCCDWMCEPAMLAKTGKGVREHQELTTRSYLQLCELAPEVPWVPVLQGWEEDDYLRHWEQQERAGIRLERLPLVGLGSVCRRQHTGQIERLVRRLQPLRLHGFGFKIQGLGRCADALVSSDSLAWSFHARQRPALPGCSHRNCANCLKWALQWRAQVLRTVEQSAWQLRLFDLAAVDG